MKPLKILLLEDNPDDAALTLATLERNGIGCDAKLVSTEREFSGALELGGFDLILSDCTLPTFSGLSALRIARELRERQAQSEAEPREIPFIFVSGSIGEEMAIETLKNGATDYVLKDRLARLVPVVHRAMAETAERNARRAAERARQEVESLFRSLFDQMGGGVAITELSGRIVQANPALETMLGYGAGELAGTGLAHLVHADDTGAGADGQRELYAGDRTNFEMERRFLRRDGVVRWGHEVVSLIRGGDGAARFQVHLIEDITERMEMQARMLQSQKMEAVGQLAAGIAHDFNNLLTVINGYSDTALTLELPKRAREQVTSIRKAGERAAGLTRQILAFSRQQVLEAKVLDLNALLRDMEEMLRRMAGEDRNFILALAAEPAVVRADPGQLEQVLMNLVVNAADATPAGGTLTVAALNLEWDDAFAAQHPYIPPGPYGGLSVTDTGMGMSAETQARIFEPFFTTKPVGRGTGLGLATVFGIVKQSGGYMTVQSELGRGTSMQVYLPSVAEIEPAAAEVEAPAVAAPGRETVLIVEDEEDVGALLQEMIENSGYTVLRATRPEEALAIGRDYPSRIALLLSDVNLHGTYGREVADQMRQLRPEIRVLFMSGFAGPEAARTGPVEPEHFIQKPFSAAALAGKVRQVLDGRG